MSPQADEPIVSETTGLLGASENADIQFRSLEQDSPSKPELEPRFPRGIVLTRLHAILLLLFGGALIAILVSMINLHPHVPSGTEVVPPLPFSLQDPVQDLGLLAYNRPKETGPPRNLFEERAAERPDSLVRHPAFPTNAWYQNLLMLRGAPSNVHRVYTNPYLVDVVGLIPGLRVHPNRILSGADVLQLTFNEKFGLTLGATGDLQGPQETEADSHKYKVLETTELGLTLRWDAMKMESTIVRGMPYVTMEYNDKTAVSSDGRTILPTIASMAVLGKSPIADGETELDCSEGAKRTLVESEVELYFRDSDFSYLVFFSEPVWLQCTSQEKTGHTFLQVLESASEGCDHPLIIRAALLDSCTNGKNYIWCREGLGNRLPEESHTKEYGSLLRQYANYYPGRHTSVRYAIREDTHEAELVLDWDVQSIPDACSQDTQSSLRKLEMKEPNLIMFALPHHLDKLDVSSLPDGIKYCKSSITGKTCLVQGTSWTILEHLPRIGLQAKRPPRPHFVPALADALREDIDYTLPDFFQRGAGDTYFSGKMLAKLGRIMLVAEEVDDLCSDNPDYTEVCKNATLPTANQTSSALDRLRSGVEIWINGTAETPFVYDVAWGGVASCGCLFNGTGCDNRAPYCPGFEDQGLNFGNAFYNDQHFHYGYHIFGAAVVAHFDPAWGRKHFEQVLLLVRSIANPSKEDSAFPLFRHKDWYQGSSWASGVPNPPYLNGKNQESTGEAIMAYESVALYGQVMSQAWESDGEMSKAAISNEVLRVGQLLTATELRSTSKYWHVMQKDENKRVYPKAYVNNVVGILWSTMVQFGTWFGAAPYLPYGIQLLPLTPISEDRDDLPWVNEMYYPFTKGCSDNFQCTDSGWSILQLATLATVGYADDAVERVKNLPNASFTNAGGNGHSKSNTIWYIATRPVVDNPVPKEQSDLRGGEEELRPAPVFVLKDCHAPTTCTDEVLDREVVKNTTCREHISWLMETHGNSQWEACFTVSGEEFPEVCGPCDPSQIPKKKNITKGTEDSALQCEPCTVEECNSDLNRCPVFDRTFVCTEGSDAGGCSGDSWLINEATCKTCCELTECQALHPHDKEAKKITHDGNALQRQSCPPCDASICYGKLNQCPIHAAPYICTSGKSLGGCSSSPWHTEQEDGPCEECCEITLTC